MRLSREWHKLIYFTILIGLFLLLISIATDTGIQYVKNTVYLLNGGHPGIVSAMCWAVFSVLIINIFIFYEGESKTTDFRFPEELMYLAGHLFMAIILSTIVYFIAEPIREGSSFWWKVALRLLYILAGFNYGNLILTFRKSYFLRRKPKLKFLKKSIG